MTPLLIDRPERTYIELPAVLDTAFVLSIDLPDRTPVLVWAHDVEQTDPLAVWLLSTRLAGRHIGFLGLSLTPGSWQMDLMTHIAMQTAAAA